MIDGHYLKNNKYAIYSLVVLLAFIVRIIALGSHSLLTDEGSMILMSRGCFGEVLDRLFYGGISHPPLQYILFHFWANVVSSDIGLRLYSALFSTLTVVLLICSLEIMNVKRPVIITASIILSTSPLCVFYAQNMKIDAFTGFVGMLIFVSFVGMVYKQSRASFFYGLLLAISIAMALYTYYFLPFLIVGIVIGQIVISFRSRQWNWIRLAALVFIVAGLLYLPWLNIMHTQVASVMNNKANTVSVDKSNVAVDRNKIILQQVEAGTSAKNSNIISVAKRSVYGNVFLNIVKDFSIGQKPFILYNSKQNNSSRYLWIIGAIVALLGVGLYLGLAVLGLIPRKPRNINDSVLFAIIVVMPLLVIIGIFAFLSLCGFMSWDNAKRYLTPHHFLFLMPFVSVMVALGVHTIRNKTLKSSALAVLILINLCNVSEIYTSKYTDYKSTIKYVNENWREGDAVVGEAFSGGEKTAAYFPELNSIDYINYSHYPWARQGMPANKEYGIFRHRQLLEHDSFDEQNVREDLLATLKNDGIKRVWMFSENGLIGSGQNIEYYDFYIEVMKTIGCVKDYKEYFNVRLYNLDLNCS